MKPNYGDEFFNQAMAKGMRFLLDPENSGPYEVNCVEGKDRTGFVIAVLECLGGASYEELIEDYMITYYNYYYLTKDDPGYPLLADFNLVSQISYCFKVSELAACDLKAAAEAYLEKCGLTETEIVQLAKVFSQTNPMMAKGKTVKVRSKSLKKHPATFTQAKAFTVKYAAGDVTFSKQSGNNKIRIAKNSKVTVKKGLKKKTYKVMALVTAAGEGDVSPASKTVTLKVQVK